jgi:hypothetical protein
VCNGKRGGATSLFRRQQRRRRVRLSELLHETFVAAVGEHALFVEQTENTHWLRLNERQCGDVIAEVDIVPFDTLCFVHRLLVFEHHLHVKLLNLLVRIVDAKLLKRVHL